MNKMNVPLNISNIDYENKNNDRNSTLNSTL